VLTLPLTYPETTMSTRRQQPTRKKAFHHGDLRRALIEEASQLLAQDGIEGLTLRSLAQRAGVSHAAPYHHFPDKAALLAAVATVGFEHLAAALRQATAAAGPEPFARLAAAGRAYIEHALSHPGYFAVMFRPDLAHPEANPGVDEASGGAFGHLVELMSECLGSSVDAKVRDMLVLTTWSTVHGAAELLVHGPMGRKSAGLAVTAAEAGARMAATMAALIREATRNHQLDHARGLSWLEACEQGLASPAQESD